MAIKNILLTTPLDTFEVSYWKGQEVYEYDARLRSFLTTRLGKPYADFFARPQVSKGKNGELVLTWVTNSLQPQFSLGSKAEGNLKATKIIESLRLMIQDLSRESGSGPDWGELLSICLDAIDEKPIFSDGEVDVLGCWGINPHVDSRPGGYQRAIMPTEIPTSNITVDQGKGKREKSNTTSHKIKSTEENDSIIQEKAEREPNIALNPNSVPASAPKKKKVKKSKKKRASKSKIEKSIIEKNVALETEETDATTKSLRRRSRFWWLLLLLAPLSGIIFWKQCIDTNKHYPRLPEFPGVLVPIDTSSIVADEDSLLVIVNNRINLLLRKPGPGLDAFADSFKLRYPDPAYQIIYFDTMLARIQLEVPIAAREQLLKDLPSQFRFFEPLVFPESIFESQGQPTDPFFRNQRISYYFDLIKVRPAWDKTYGSEQVIVAVIDDGCDLNHPEFIRRIIRPYNIISRSKRVYGGALHQHGTHVAGTAVGARDNREGLAGIAPDCLLMPIQVADQNGKLSTSSIVDGVLYAINNGASVINLSLGRKFGPLMQNMPEGFQRNLIDTKWKDEEYFWEEILNLAEENGVAVVMAGGNESILIGIDPMQRSSLGVKVAAVNREAQRAGFSNYGEYATVSAPGVDIISSVPGSGFATMQGTSMAAPMVTGAIGLAQALDPDITPAEIRELLVRTARRTDPSVGPLLQIGPFLDAVNGGTLPVQNEEDEVCADIDRQIRELEQRIEELKQGCKNYETTPDTMVMTPEPSDLDFTLGRWKSTSPLRNADTGEQITLFFTFLSNATGELTLVEASGMRCSSDLSLKRTQRRFVIDQQTGADCHSGKYSYNPYIFRCEADVNGIVVCEGENKINPGIKPRFNLVRIN